MGDLYTIIKNIYDDEIKEKSEILKTKQFHLMALLGIITFMYYLGTLLPKNWKERTIQFNDNFRIPIWFFIIIIISFFVYYFIRLIKFLNYYPYLYLDSSKLGEYYNDLNNYYIDSENIDNNLRNDFTKGAIDVMFMCIKKNREVNIFKKSQSNKLLKSLFLFFICVLITLLIFLIFLSC